VAAIFLDLRALGAGATRMARWVENWVRKRLWYSGQRRRCLEGKKPRLLLYSLQHSVRPTAEGGRDQIRERVLRVGDLVSRKHGGFLEDAVARADVLRECSSGCYSESWRRPGLTNARATRAKWQSLAYAFEVAAVAVSGAEEGSADDVVGRAGAPGSRLQGSPLP
jgi:hypothetical protein